MSTAIDCWNVRNRTLLGTGQINNMIGIFIMVLKEVHKSVEADINDVQQGKEINKPRQVWFKAEQRKREVVHAYTPADYIALLKNVADTLIL
uniref:Uncharacterized protein n=1 Tax=Acrobeloides nanus TaxID=290746 RepID=A0A914E9P2_9BILA